MRTTMINDEAVTQKMSEILSKEYARRLVPDESGGYVASIHEFPGCIAEGDTADEAIKNLDEVAASWVKVALSNGYEIREPVSFHGYSGKIALRIPRGLHKQAAELAEQEETSVNQLLVTAIAQYVAGKCAQIKLSESMIFEMRKIMSDGLISFYRNSQWTVSIISSTAQKQLVKTDTTSEGEVVTAHPYRLGAV